MPNLSIHNLKMLIICSIIKKTSRKKGVCIFILKKKIKHYTKEVLKMLNVVAFGAIFIIAIVLLKYKPVYKVTISGEEVGYVTNKMELEEKIQKEILESKEANVAYTKLNCEPEYAFKFVSGLEETNEEEVFMAIKEQAVTTYVMYAVTLNDETKAYVDSIEEAQTMVDELKQEYDQDLELDIAISQTYTQNVEELNVLEPIEVAKTSFDEILETMVEEKKEKEERTVNGIYLAVQPISGTITSRYASISRLRSGAHTGLDIAAPKGTPIKVVTSGTVTFSGWNGAYGKCIKVSHGNGVETWYAHCSKLYVEAGDTVEAGEVIGAVGTTGNSTGNHLHLEIRIDGEPVNPQNYLYR